MFGMRNVTHLGKVRVKSLSKETELPDRKLLFQEELYAGSLGVDSPLPVEAESGVESSTQPGVDSSIRPGVAGVPHHAGVRLVGLEFLELT